MSEFLALVLALLATAFLLRIDFIFYIVYVCLGLYLWIRWYTPRAFNRLQGRRRYPQRAFWGELVTVEVEIRNNNRLPLPWVEVSETIPPLLRVGQEIQAATSLGGRSTAVFHYQIKTSRRGYYQLGPTRLASGDLFGLLPIQQGYVPADYITIYPRLIPLTRLGLPARLPFGAIPSQQRLFADPTQPIGVREYRSGDSMRRINWKVSAHTRDLMVKTYQPAISLETAVLLNLHLSAYRRKERYSTIEWAVVVAASLAAHLSDRRQPVGLISNGIDPLQAMDPDAALKFDVESGRLQRHASDSTGSKVLPMPPPLPPRPGRAQLMKILEHLARLEAAETVSLTQWLPQATLPLSWGVTLLVVTARGDVETCQALHRLVRSGFNPILITIEPDYNFGEVRQRARQLGFRAYNVARERDLDQWKRPWPHIS